MRVWLEQFERELQELQNRKQAADGQVPETSAPDIAGVYFDRAVESYRELVGWAKTLLDSSTDLLAAMTQSANNDHMIQLMNVVDSWSYVPRIFHPVFNSTANHGHGRYYMQGDPFCYQLAKLVAERFTEFQKLEEGVILSKVKEMAAPTLASFSFTLANRIYRYALGQKFVPQREEAEACRQALLALLKELRSSAADYEAGAKTFNEILLRLKVLPVAVPEFTMDGSVVHYQDKSGRLQSANEINLTEYPKFVCDLLSKYGPEYSYEKIDVYDLFGVRDNPLDARNVFLYMYFLRSKDSVVHVVYDELKTSLGEQHELLRQAKASINALDKRIDDEKEAFGSRDEQHQWSREIHKNVVNLRTALAQFSEFKPGAGIVGGVFGLLSSSSAKANLARDAEGLLGRELYAAISPYVDITQANDGILQWALVATFEHLSEELDGITQKFHDRYQKEKQQHGENAVGKALEAYIDAAKATCTYQAYQDGESDLAVTEGFGY